LPRGMAPCCWAGARCWMPMPQRGADRARGFPRFVKGHRNFAARSSNMLHRTWDEW
jgi:hypothetical protein